MTDFIRRPDALSWVVALLAGIAAMMSLTSNNVRPLVGVLISVTTVPAAANAAVARVTSRRSVDGDGNPRPPLIRQAARPTPVTNRP